MKHFLQYPFVLLASNGVRARGARATRARTPLAPKQRAAERVLFGNLEKNSIDSVSEWDWLVGQFLKMS